MDSLLGRSQIPSDYGATMAALCLDSSQDALTRDFAAQHIGLYAQVLRRRGAYDAKSDDARRCRDALFEAAGETGSTVAAAALRALADMSEFDSRLDNGRLDSMVSACAGNRAASIAARTMAVQLCGERRIMSSRNVLRAIADDHGEPEILRRSARYALDSMKK